MLIDKIGIFYLEYSYNNPVASVEKFWNKPKGVPACQPAGKPCKISGFRPSPG
jgi:hypothetical protein